MLSKSLWLFILVAAAFGHALAKTCTKELRFTYMTWRMDPITQRLKSMPQAVRRISVVCCPGYQQVGRRGMTPLCEPVCQSHCHGGYCDINDQCVCYEGYKLLENGGCEREEAKQTTSTSTTPSTPTNRPTTASTTTTTTTTMRPTTTTTTTTTTMRPTTTTTTTLPTTTTTTTTMRPTTTTTMTMSTTTPKTRTPRPTTTTTTTPTTIPTTTTTTTTTTTIPTIASTTTTATTRTTTPTTSTTTTFRTISTIAATPEIAMIPTTTTTTALPLEESPLVRRMSRTQGLQPKAVIPYKTSEHKPMSLEPKIEPAPGAEHMKSLECEGNVNCACSAGYTLDSQLSKCRPLCNGKIYGCIGGTCIGINQCRCDEGTHLAAGELFHCEAVHPYWKWALLLLLIPAVLIVVSLVIAIRRWRTARANRLKAIGESFSVVPLNRSSSNHDDDEVSLAQCSINKQSVHYEKILDFD